MSLSSTQVLDYLDNHSICKHSGDFQSLLEMIHSIYTSSNPISSDEIRTYFQQAETLLLELSPEKAEELFWLISGLCEQYEHTAFSHGILVGMQLMTELNGLH